MDGVNYLIGEGDAMHLLMVLGMMMIFIILNGETD